ncbi:cobaltochelatase subunit CobN [Variovorax sp. LT2P21]|uniref:cobaltochelatase subunit CobN n=1 Tax=Variovorax sp. LT2P21 TaxID=3443731 RepID=UPI003F4883D4
MRMGRVGCGWLGAWLCLALGAFGPVIALAQTLPASPRIVLLSTRLVPPTRLAHQQAAARDAGLPLQVVSATEDTPEALDKALDGARLLVIDAPHLSLTQAAAERFGDVIARSTTPYVLVGEFGLVAKGQLSAAPPIAADRGVDPAWAQRLRAYWRFSGNENLRAAMRALGRVGDMAGLPAPVVLPLAGFYHPGWPRVEADIASLNGLPGASNAATVAIAVNVATLTSDDTDWLDRTIRGMEQRGLRAYAFYGPRQQKDLFFRMTHATGADGSARRVVDVIVNAALVFNPNDRKAELERIGVPVLQTLPAGAMDAAQWARSTEGLAPADIAYYYSPSELAGMTDAMLVTARDVATGSLQPLPAQIDAVADKAAALVRLQRTPPAERRVAMLVYNYPPGEANFGASFLNVPRSVDGMLAAMQRAGYRTDAPGSEALIAKVQATMQAYYPVPGNDALQPLLAQDLADALPLSRYLAWFRALPATTQQRIEAYWGPPASSTMLREVGGAPAFVIPRVRFGQVVVLRQPPRFEPGTAVRDRAGKVYHRSAVPLSHGYLATYLWLRTQFGASALVHVGTHGTVEWSAGKERGLSVQDDPMLALGDLPNVYPYVMDNLGEATTAKRRGRATMVSHSTPMFSPAGFRPGVQAMHERMHDWETLSPGPVKRAMEAGLAKEFIAQHYDRDLQWAPARIRADFAGFIAVLHPYLDELAQTAQPLGLATFGEAPDATRRRLTVLQILRKPLAEALHLDADEAFLLEPKNLAMSPMVQWLERALRHAETADSDALRALAERARQLDAVLAHNEEIDGLLTALDGRYLKASYGGDPVRNPDSLPTGRNLYGFDPSRVPTRAAWDVGTAALDAWVAAHAMNHQGKAPGKIAFTLWAGETLRHQGVMESQAFYAMGVKPRWDDAGRMTGIDVIPDAVLRRPRIDVLVSVTGSYRDQFPAVMRWLDEAVRQVAAMPSANNFVARHSEALARRMTADGASPAEAQRWSTARVFSNESGSYGAGLEEAAMASELWRTQRRGGGDAQMARLFIDRMGHAYGEGLDSAAPPGAFAGNLAQVDAALMSRTSNLYGVLTNDDPFQYLGGIAQAVRQLTGKDPALYVQNLREGTAVRTDTAAGAIAREMQTRYLHSQWIEAQKAEGYSGALQVLKTAQFLWGWQVTAPAAVRQDQWQSLHDVYVRDRYQLGTRQWLEGANRAAFAQTLERLLDAVRLDYWRPDAATRRELAQAYVAAAAASGLRERHAEVARYAQAELQTAPRETVAAPRPIEVMTVRDAPVPVEVAPPPSPIAAEPATDRVQGLKLEPVPEPTRAAPPVVQGLWAAFGVAMLMALGAWSQWRRSRRAVPA